MPQHQGRPKFPAPLPNPLAQSDTLELDFSAAEDEKTDPNLALPPKVAKVRSITAAPEGARAPAPQSQGAPAAVALPPRSSAVPASVASPSVATPMAAPRPEARMPDMGLLDPFMKDPGVSEIMVNDLRNVMLEKAGKLLFSGLVYRNIEDLNRLIRGILDITGRILSPEQPYVDTMLPDGSRVNIVIPPLAVTGPCITIRKFPARTFRIEDLLTVEMMNKKIAYFLNVCIVGRVNLLISGGTGTGKTTLLNALARLIPKGERIITIEDTPEISLQHANSVRMQTKPATPASTAITARDLLANSLRMRPDRIIVGECRKGEAFDMLQAMNTGHEGSMTTLHANSPREALSRLETLCMLSGMDLPLAAIRKQTASSLDLIVHLRRFRSGRRKIVAVTEVTGMEGETITLQDIFLSEQEKSPFKSTGFVPTFVERLREQGIEIPRDFF